MTRLAIGSAVLLGATIVAAGAAMPAAHADISYTGHAEAHGFRFTTSNPAFPVGFVLEGDSPIATSDLSSLGDSQALAAGPYPGTNAAATSGTVGGIIGLPIPPYPVVATASAGDDPAEQNLPGLSLRADPGANRAEGSALMGSGGLGASALAVVDATRRDTDGVTAEATARVEALALLDYLHVQRVESRALTLLDATGHRTSSSDLRVDGIYAPGLQFTVPRQTAGQIPLPNPAPGLPQPPPLVFAPVPVPGGGGTLAGPELGFHNGEFVVTATSAGITQRYPVPFDTVADAFAAIGWKVAFQPEQRTDTGVIGATLTFRTDLPAPPANPSGVDQATPVTLEFGRAAASVAGQALRGPGVGSSGGLATPGPSTGTPSGTLPGTTGSDLAGLVPSLGGAVPETGEPGAGTVALTTSAGPGATSPFTDLYAVFVVVALVVLVAGPVTTLLGTRSRWGS